MKTRELMKATHEQNKMTISITKVAQWSVLVYHSKALLNFEELLESVDGCSETIPRESN